MVEKELPFTHKPAEAFTKLKISVSGVNYLYTKALFPTEKDREAALNAESWAEENAQEIHPNDLLRQIGRQFGFRPLVRLLEYRYPSVQGSDDVTKRSVLYETALQENSKLQSHAFNIELGVEKPERRSQDIIKILEGLKRFQSDLRERAQPTPPSQKK